MAASLTTQLEESRQAEQRREEVVESLREKLNAAHQPGPNLHLHRLKLPELREEVTKSENPGGRAQTVAGMGRHAEGDRARGVVQPEPDRGRVDERSQSHTIGAKNWTRYGI